MALSTGTKLGPYEILSAAGSGGMGEVYRARDSRLDRIVAVKILPEAFATDANRLRRFEQESQSIAALNHSNIVAVYDVGLHESSPYLVMEFLEGKTLRERLNEGPLPVGKAVEVAQQIARALAVAHERGIVHRDLKPENIFLTRDGSVKLLDFGLAKAALTPSAEVTPSSQTQTSPGVVLGTAGYMAPEQVRGEVVDHRADIFSFGAVLYEMIGGKRAFVGDSSVEVMTAILRSEPQEFDPTTKISPGLDRIIRHCLEKNPADRFQTARDLTFALTALSGSDSATAFRPASSDSQHRGIIRAIVALACLAIFIASIAWLDRPRPASVKRQQFAIPVLGDVAYIGISPDGEMLAYVAPDENTGMGVLYLQAIGEPTATKLDNTEGATYPFFSPDHKYVAFFAGGKLKKVSVEGGVPQTLANVTSARGGSWGSQNVILYAADAGGPLLRINADGTNGAQATHYLFGAAEVSNRFPVFLPDGEHFLFWAGNFDELPNDQLSGVYLSSLSNPERRQIVKARSSPGYSEGHLFYINDQNSLTMLPIDKNGVVTGQPNIVASPVGRYPSTYWGAFSVALNGTVLYGVGTGAPTSQLTWYDRTGNEVGTLGEPAVMANPKLSPDDNWVAVDLIDLKAHNIDVWLQNLTGHTMSRFTFLPAEETNAAWSRDGSMIAFRSGGRRRLSIKPARGLGEERQILDTTHNGDPIPTGWTPDGKQVLITSQDPKGGSDLELVSLDGKVTPLLNSPASETNGQISPDGKWMIYASDESGDWQVYATSFPTPGGKVQISRDEGSEPRWGPDGKEIFYIGPHRMLMVTSLNTEGTLSTGVPRPLFQLRGRAPISSTDLFTYDVTKDGKRFLVNRYMKPTDVPPINIILNSTSH